MLTLLLFQCGGELLKTYLGWSIPGAVLGMFGLFAWLCLVKQVSEPLQTVSQPLIQLLTLMFLPTTVGLFFLGEEYNDQWPAILGACLLASWVAIFVVALLLKFWLRRDRIGDAA